MDEFKVLIDYPNHLEADFAKELLASHAISAFTKSDDCGGMAGGQTFVRGVQLLVHEKDLEQAKAILL